MERAMLFNSSVFLFVFLPLTFAVWTMCCRLHWTQAALWWLLSASLFFYGWWNPPYLVLLLASILVNYLFQRRIHELVAAKAMDIAKRWLVVGVVLNLAAIGYFKYADFFLRNVNRVFHTHFPALEIFLPLGISFYTFQQIACLVDTYRGELGRIPLQKFALFTAFFPQLVAGPIVLANRLVPQLEGRRIFVFSWRNVYFGLVLFSLGLFKKVVIADRLSPHIASVFNNLGGGVGLFDAWSGVLAYTFQLYFDFSGYSDMALGLARLFNVDLPLNFNSPYKAASIIEFWRRWHMTLSRFLRDYLYIPLGGNRKGSVRRYANLLATMLIGGLWHGAGWTFVVWGGLHGLYLCVNHFWLKVSPIRLPKVLGIVLTFFSIVVAWVFFRAGSMGDALVVLKAMFSFGDLSLPHLLPSLKKLAADLPNNEILLELLLCAAICFLLPNSMQVAHMLRNIMESSLALVKQTSGGTLRIVREIALVQRLTLVFVSLCIGGMLTTTFLFLNTVSEFLYFQF